MDRLLKGVKAVITLKEVSFAYENGDGQGGLRNINLTINDGEFVLLCGGSGCGKTTLTRLINGLIPNFYAGRLTGEVLVNGIEVSGAPLYETSGMVGSVFQNPRSQFFNVDTTSELAFCCENMGYPEEEIRRRVKRTAEELRLEPLLDRSIFALSGGEKQKIACGSVAALEPQVVVLDEPSSNLDTFAVEELKQLLAHWKAQKKTVIIAEHRLYYLCELVDRVFYMEEGEVCSEFSGREFRALPNSRLAEMGLRVLSLESLWGSVAARKPGITEHIALSDFIYAYPHCQETLCVDQAVVPLGAVAAVIGHNGAGKTTFARCLCGLEKRCCATLELQGCRLSGKQRLKRCYMVMQDVNHQLFTESVLDEVLISMENESETAARAVLAGLDLSAVENLHPMSLSGGQKQRVAIASAVASERDIIIFDEPTSGLDLRHMREVAENLRQLAAAGKTVFVITHDPEFIVSCCTHLMQFEKGRLVFNEPLDERGMDQMLRYFLDAAPGWEKLTERAV